MFTKKRTNEHFKVWPNDIRIREWMMVQNINKTWNDGRLWNEYERAGASFKTFIIPLPNEGSSLHLKANSIITSKPIQAKIISWMRNNETPPISIEHTEQSR